MTYKDYIHYLINSMETISKEYNDILEIHKDTINNEISVEDLSYYGALNQVICSITYDIQDDLNFDLQNFN